MKHPLVFYIDVDDTLVRHVGTKRIPIPNVVAHVRKLSVEGFAMYCWSTGGAEYAQSIALELGIADCFKGFLPKPNVLIDDQEVNLWKRLICVHPLEIDDDSIKTYAARIDNSDRK